MLRQLADPMTSPSRNCATALRPLSGSTPRVAGSPGWRSAYRSREAARGVRGRRQLQLTGLLLLGALYLATSDRVVLAQGQEAPPSGEERPARLERGSLTNPDMHVREVDPRTKNPIDPKVDKFLMEWSQHTKQIKKLQGKHYRAIRDFVNETETLAEGYFYVETPDKGRIDVKEFNGEPKVGSQVVRVTPDDKKMKLTVTREHTVEKWICDGRDIKRFNDAQKTFDVVLIPPEQRGENIVDGPLPFLFGMPPEKAKARYRFILMHQDKSHCQLDVRPKLKQDAMEWRRAIVVLNCENHYLPERVHLYSPDGNKETDYFFQKIEVNKTILFPIFSSDPFKPSLFGYKQEVHQEAIVKSDQAGAPKTPRAGGARMPLVIGADSPAALRFQELAKKRGFHVIFKPGTPAPSKKEEFHIKDQEPAPNTPLHPGDPITLVYYTSVDQGQQNPGPQVSPAGQLQAGPRTATKIPTE